MDLTLSYDPKFLFSCDFISIPYSEAGTAFGLFQLFFGDVCRLLFSFFLRLFRTLDGVRRGLGMVLGYGKYHLGQGL